ncbi:MAG: cupin domain-containing protein [Holophaga sp.]|nr:cupin domain-containing protein [Holophaga sp.]
MMPPRLDLPALLASFSDHWQPRTIGRFNGNELRLVKFQGEFVWHRHPADEMFLVVAGTMTLRFRDGEHRLEPGQACVIPAGTEHITLAESECQALVLDVEDEPNTGDAGGSMTAMSAPIQSVMLP